MLSPLGRLTLPLSPLPPTLAPLVIIHFLPLVAPFRRRLFPALAISRYSKEFSPARRIQRCDEAV
jgi:hypothetical protein